MILKWHDKSGVLMLPTLHDELVGEKEKLQVILHYKIGKIFVDLSDEITAYCS